MTEGTRPPERFSLCTWNCFGAAQGLVSVLRGRGAAAAHRFEHPDLHEELTRVDILCAQELWLEDAVHAFHKPAHLPNRLLAENRWTFLPLTIAGSGLGIASRFRVVASRFASFSRPHAGSERFARKGMAYARIALPSGSELDVVTTHMQSGYTDLAAAVRARHLGELRAFADEVGSDDRPLVVAGDLNVDGRLAVRDLEYRTLEDVFSGVTDVFRDDDPITFHPTGNGLAGKYEPDAADQRVDYVLIRDRGRTLEVLERERFLDDVLPARGAHGAIHASDHYALRVELRER